jgi:hypothetical protein
MERRTSSYRQPPHFGVPFLPGLFAVVRFIYPIFIAACGFGDVLRARKRASSRRRAVSSSPESDVSKGLFFMDHSDNEKPLAITKEFALPQPSAIFTALSPHYTNRLKS